MSLCEFTLEWYILAVFIECDSRFVADVLSNHVLYGSRVDFTRLVHGEIFQVHLRHDNGS